VGWVYSRPIEPAAAGGDVHYFSICSEGILSRFVLADVSGHGQCSSLTANRLRELIRKYIDVWDQTALMRDLNEALRRDTPQEHYATAIVFGYCSVTGELAFTNAGHPPPLWYHAGSGTWDWLDTTSPFLVSPKDLPLGLIRGTRYVQQAVRLAPRDMLIIYTDGITEARNAKNHFLGQKGLLAVAGDLPTGSPSAAAFQLNSALRSFRGNTPVDDDETFIVLQQTGEF
jgi:serine phosphatase RsbU (regulator of sigma subunit)